MYTVRIIAIVLAAVLAGSPAAFGAKKKKKNPNEFPPVIIKSKEKEREPITQVLPPTKDPPAAVFADSTRLSFVVSPLSSRGLLTQQTRDAIKWLLQTVRSGSVVKIRAFVAGTGDMRRVGEIVSEEFGGKRLNLPALSVAQVGALPLDGAQVQLEATVVEKRAVTEHGVAYISAQHASSRDAAGPLLAAVRAANLDGGDVRHVTCFVTSFDELNAMRSQVAQTFPKAATSYVQVLRGALGEFADCEAVAALKRAPEQPVVFAGTSGGFAAAALVGPGRLVITGSQMGFESEDANLRLGLDRLRKTLESSGSSYKQAVMTHVYTLLKTTGERIGKLLPDYMGTNAATAGSVIVFEGLPGLDASFAVDVVALVSAPAPAGDQSGK